MKKIKSVVNKSARSKKNADPTTLDPNLIWVYVYGSSNVYHEDKQKYKTPERKITLAQALQEGLRACKRCSKN